MTGEVYDSPAGEEPTEIGLKVDKRHCNGAVAILSASPHGRIHPRRVRAGGCAWSQKAKYRTEWEPMKRLVTVDEEECRRAHGRRALPWSRFARAAGHKAEE